MFLDSRAPGWMVENLSKIVTTTIEEILRWQPWLNPPLVEMSGATSTQWEEQSKESTAHDSLEENPRRAKREVQKEKKVMVTRRDT